MSNKLTENRLYQIIKGDPIHFLKLTTKELYYKYTKIESDKTYSPPDKSVQVSEFLLTPAEWTILSGDMLYINPLGVSKSIQTGYLFNEDY